MGLATLPIARRSKCTVIPKIRQKKITSLRVQGVNKGDKEYRYQNRERSCVVSVQIE